MKRYKRFFEEAIPDWVYDELRRYVRTAGRRLDTDVIAEVSKFKPNKPITIYRGMGFEKAEASSILKKLKVKDLKVGTPCTYRTGKIQSWSLSKKIAEDFAGLFMFGGIRQADSLGIILEIQNLPAKDIAVPIAYINPILDKPLPFNEQEEILINPGTYRAKIVEFIGDWENSYGVDIQKTIKDLATKAQKYTGGDIAKTWNRDPGFALKFKHLYYDIKKKWSPSLELHVDNTLVYIDVFGGNFISEEKVKEKIKETTIKSRKKFKTLSETQEYLQSDIFFAYIKNIYDIMKTIEFKQR